MSPKITYPTELPRSPTRITLVRVAYEPAQSRSKREDTVFAERLTHLQDAFRIRGQMEDQGTEVVMRVGSQQLRVFRSSQSFRWVDENLACSEKISTTLPHDEEAVEIAQAHLKRLGLTTDNAKVTGVDRMSVAVSDPDGSGIREAGASEVQVLFGFWLDDLPVLGPGAKIKVSLVANGEVSSVLWFWREPIVDEAAPRLSVLPVERALERLARSYGNAAANTETRVNLRNVRLGHYALPPFEAQKFLIPVYEATGTEETRLLGSREIVSYVPAVRLSDRQVKEMGMVPEPNLARYLAGTKAG